MTQGEYIAEVFGPGGMLARAFPGYEPREGQIALVHAVDTTIRDGVPVIAEAPTGVGKGLSYLVPATWHLVRGREALLARRGRIFGANEFDEDEPPSPKALIVTANIALQDQLLRKDIPALQRALPWKFTAAIAKGRSNFLCV